MPNSALPLQVATPGDVENIREYCAGLVEAKRSKRAVSQSIPPETEVWVRTFIHDDTIAGIELALNAINTLFESVHIIELDTAEILSPLLQDKIIEWLRSEINPMVLIRSHIDRSLMGGMRIRTSRAEYDLSIRNSLERSREYLTGVVHGWV